MSKKKLTNAEKKLRRQVEALKAQVKTEASVSKRAIEVTKKITTSQATPLKYELPITIIKRDLLKTTLYATFSILVLIALKFTNITPSILSKF